ncbi:transglycosylase domain-containing protein [Psychrilyobacter atlanticus]|uniref:transglycosylase domain-containing protein n=1 Tax=Psychrilyobacter atlanticus TaxID=271091 RepID=UPI0004236429|nr:PBP1A family penicillin-binding protein [Psychrilyobacter atlanticus]
MKKLFRNILFIFIGLFILGGVGATVLIVKAYRELPDLGQLIEGYNPVVPSKIYDTNGEVIDILYKEIRETATIEEMPKSLKDAYVAIEDRRFYSHHGFDVLGMGRAMVVNVVTMSKAQGASSITQQLAKNAFLTNEKRIMRKVKEAIITVELERGYTKDEILEKYMNEIYFGSGAYGVKTAARAFYGKSVGDINIAESALLAGVPNRPNKYNPRRHLNNAIARGKLVLAQMRRYNLIDEEEYQKALSQKFYNEGQLPDELKDLSVEELSKLNVTVIKSVSKKRSYKTPDFTNIVEKKLFELFTEKQIYEEGLEVYTTLDIGMQKAAKLTFENYKPLKDKKGLDGGMVTIEADTGYVRAVIGGKGFKSGDYNRAIYAKRQPGSAFKPFVYFTALRLGYPMNTVIEDTPLEFGEWKPRNYGGNFRKNFTLLEGMERSINIVAIKTLQKVGLKNVGETVKLAGGEDIKIPQNLTAALGTMVVTPYELSSLYLPFANGGYRVKPQFITQIKNRYGKVIYQEQAEQQRVFKGEDVALITHMMEDVVNLGSGRNARVKKDGKNIVQGGKTGTTNRQRTAWFAGITPKYVTTVYIGYDDNRPMDKSATGGGLTAKLWGNYYQMLVDDGYDTGKEFNYITDGLKNGKLSKVLIDSKNGRLADSTSGWNKRWALFKKGTEPVEMASIYNSDFNDFFMGSDEIMMDKVEETRESKKNMEQNEKNINSDSMFKDLFGN